MQPTLRAAERFRSTSPACRLTPQGSLLLRAHRPETPSCFSSPQRPGTRGQAQPAHRAESPPKCPSKLAPSCPLPSLKPRGATQAAAASPPLLPLLPPDPGLPYSALAEVGAARLQDPGGQQASPSAPPPLPPPPCPSARPLLGGQAAPDAPPPPAHRGSTLPTLGPLTQQLRPQPHPVSRPASVPGLYKVWPLTESLWQSEPRLLAAKFSVLDTKWKT